MKDIIQGVYKITNLIDGKCYIGISNNIYERWQQHRSGIGSIQPQLQKKTLTKAFKKYGLENFSFEILQEENDPEKRKQLEIYYINKFDSYKNGYNDTPGGDGNPRNKLEESDIYDIRNRYKNGDRCMIVYEDYKNRIGKSGFNKIWKGETWSYIMPEIYTPERALYNKMHTGNPGAYNGRAKISKEEVLKIRERYKNGESIFSIFQDYKDRYASVDSFRELVKGKRYKIDS